MYLVEVNYRIRNRVVEYVSSIRQLHRIRTSFILFPFFLPFFFFFFFGGKFEKRRNVRDNGEELGQKKKRLQTGLGESN